MKRLLVICQNYPSLENPFSQPFIHYRLKEYLPHYDVTVLSFASKADYEYEGVNVYTEKSISNILSSKHFDLVISHAPNVRNHQRFLLLNIFKIQKIIFIFHGYEVIDIHKRVYNQKTLYNFPLKYSFPSKFYHQIKLPLTCLFLKLMNSLVKCRFIFVSETLLREAKEDLGCKLFQKNFNTFVINNPINPAFFEKGVESSKDFDFICIRPFDDPKYGVDIFIKLAENNPHFSFHLYGRGTLPEIKLPNNLVVFQKFLTTIELKSILSKYRSAILPTRWDSQGVLACEIASLGMPLITSKISVVHEFLGALENVILLDNENFHACNLSTLKFATVKNSVNQFSFECTTKKEIQLVTELTNQS